MKLTNKQKAEKEKYVFVSYDKRYPLLFERQLRKLRKLIGRGAKIEHVGSTAVPNLGGKGIIDIIIGVSKKDIIKIKNKLERGGYKFRHDFGNNERLYFTKNYTDKGKKRTVHVHLTFFNNMTWKSTIKVRDYLIQNKNVKEEYARLKKEGVNVARGIGEKYRKHKHNFLKRLEKKSSN